MKQILKKLAVVLIILALVTPLVLPAINAAAQETIQVTDQAVDYVFRDHLTFTLEAASTADISKVDLYYRIVGRPATSRNEAEFTPGSSVSAEFKLDQTKPENYFPPGTELE